MVTNLIPYELIGWYRQFKRRRLQGKHGLLSDGVRKFGLALINGTIFEASRMVNSYLFWGVRGAGQNFGVVIEATLETYPKTNGGDFYNADMTFAEGHLDSVIDAMNSLYPLDDDGFAHFLCGLCHNPRGTSSHRQITAPCT